MSGQGATNKIIALGIGALTLVFGPPLLFLDGWLTADQVVAIVLLGILSMLGVLLSFAMMMKLVGISDPAQALGMPEGSVRAMLALALIGLFAVLAAVVFERPSALRESGLTQPQVELFRKNNPDLAARALIIPEAKTETFQVVITGTPRVVDDFVKTTMASVATLMTAIVAFYFGGRGNETSQGRRGAPPMLSGLLGAAEHSVANSPLKLRLSGRNLNDVRKVRLKSGATVVDGGVPTSNDSEIMCDVAVSAATTPPGTYDIEVVDGAGNASELKGVLTLLP